MLKLEEKYIDDFIAEQKIKIDPRSEIIYSQLVFFLNNQVRDYLESSQQPPFLDFIYQCA